MTNITVGFSKAKGFSPYGWLIMVGLNIPFSHVYIKIHSMKYDRDLIYQASSTMVNFMSPAIMDSEHVVVKEFVLPISDENYIKMMQFAIDNAGKPYGIKEVVGMAIVRVFQIFGKKIKNPFKDGGNTYVCSELVGTIVNEFLNGKIPGDQDDFTPKEVYDYLSKN